MFGFFKNNTKQKRDLQVKSSRPIVVNSRDEFNFGNLLSAKFSIFNTRNAFAAYNSIVELASIVDYISNAGARGEWKLYKTDASGQTTEPATTSKDIEVLTRLNNPNPLQTGFEFRRDALKNLLIAGDFYMSKDGKFTNPSAIWLLKNQQTTIYYKNSNQFKLPLGEANPTIEHIVDYYEYDNTNETKRLLPSEIIHGRLSTIGSDGLEGNSPLKPLNNQIETAEATSEADFVLIKKRGAIGVLTKKMSNNDMAALTEISPEERAEIKRLLTEDCGLDRNQSQIIVTENEYNYLQLIMNRKDLGIDEVRRAIAIAFCMRFNFPFAKLYPENATYNNILNFDKQLIKDTIQPIAETFAAAIQKGLVTMPNRKLVLELPEPEISAQERKQSAETNSIKIRDIINLNNEIANGIITKEKAAIIFSEQHKVSYDKAINYFTDKQPMSNEPNNV